MIAISFVKELNITFLSKVLFAEISVINILIIDTGIYPCSTKTLIWPVTDKSVDVVFYVLLMHSQIIYER